MPQSKEQISIHGRSVPVSNLEKLLYPSGFTKKQVIDYYVGIADVILPHLKDRPVTLKRFPDGVKGKFFYEKNAPRFTPDWVQTFGVPRREGGLNIRYILINDAATLAWVANTASLEIHPFLHRVPEIQQPTSIVFDLDPGEGADILTCGEVAFLLRDLMSELDLQSFVKVSGSKGLQLYVPLNTKIDYTVTQPFAKAVADLLCEKHPDLIVSSMAKRVRGKKVFIDWSQNSDFKTTVSVYSLRAKSDSPFVSAPITWNELRKAMKAKNPQKLYFDPAEALKRAKRLGDLFEPVLELKQRLPKNILSSVSAVPEAGTKAKPLETYRRKRDFSQTPEPSAALPRRSRQGSTRRFVIQKHAASHLHYDFRLEMDGVLKSWAVPKGLPSQASDKRLAMATEDHPLGYLDFEGIIPKGQYGGGTVMVWDIGTFELIEGNYWKGHLRFQLNGKKLKGEWTLVRSSDGNKWFVIKTGDSIRPISERQDDCSALSSRSMTQITKAADATWQSNR